VLFYIIWVWFFFGGCGSGCHQSVVVVLPSVLFQLIVQVNCDILIYSEHGDEKCQMDQVVSSTNFYPIYRFL
jgi:hypothetical protein